MTGAPTAPAASAIHAFKDISLLDPPAWPAYPTA